MKTLFPFIYILAAMSAQAQYSVNTSISGLIGTTNVVTAGATSNYTASVQIARTRYVAIRVQFTTTNTGASGNLFSVWQTSLDNTNWSNALVLTNAASGTNIVSAQTNQFDIGSLQYLRLRYITNSVSHQVTNLLATVTYKVSVAQDVISAIGYDVQPASTTLSNWAVLPDTLFQRADSDLTNWAALSDTSFQRASLNLTNWGQLDTNNYFLIKTNIASTPTNTSTPYEWRTLSSGGATPVYY